MTEATGLAGIDYLIVLVYLVGTLVLGTFLGRYVRTADDFFIASRALPFWAIGMSIVVSDIGATDFIAVAGGTYSYGLAQANFDWLGSIPALVIAAFLFIPYYWRAGVYTVAEFLGRRYGPEVRFLVALAWGLILVANLGIMLHATSLLLRAVMGWDPLVSIWVVTGVVGIYTISGGLAAVVMTDVVQLVVMFVGGAALVVRSVYEVGGWASMKAQVLARGPAFQDHYTLFLPHDTQTPFPWTGIVLGLGIVLSTAYFSGNQAMVQRALGARTEWDAKAGVLLAGFLKLFIPLLVAVPGLAAVVLLPDLAAADEAIPQLIRLLLPPGLRGVMFAAFLAGLMSSVDSYVNSAATIWTHDIIGRIRVGLGGAPLSGRVALLLGRVLGGVMLLAAALFAPEVERRFSGIYSAIQTIFSLIQGPSLAILLMGLLWRRTTRWGGLAGLLGGVGLAMTLNADSMRGIFASQEPYLFVAWWTFVFSLAVTALVSLATPPEPPEKLRGLVWGEVLEDDAVQQALRARVAATEEE